MADKVFIYQDTSDKLLQHIKFVEKSLDDSPSQAKRDYLKELKADYEAALRHEAQNFSGPLAMIIDQKIKKFLDSEDTEVELTMYPLMKYKNFFEKLGFKWLNDQGDTNGWQVDFWEYSTYKGQKFLLEGSLWYGDFKFKKVK